MRLKHYEFKVAQRHQIAWMCTYIICVIQKNDSSFTINCRSYFLWHMVQYGPHFSSFQIPVLTLTKSNNESAYARQDHLPMHRDAEDLLHGGEDLADYFLAPVSSMLRDDNGFVDVCNDSMLKGLLSCGLTVTVKVHTLMQCQSKSPPNWMHVTFLTQRTLLECFINAFLEKYPQSSFFMFCFFLFFMTVAFSNMQKKYV